MNLWAIRKGILMVQAWKLHNMGMSETFIQTYITKAMDKMIHVHHA